MISEWAERRLKVASQPIKNATGSTNTNEEGIPSKKIFRMLKKPAPPARSSAAKSNAFPTRKIPTSIKEAVKNIEKNSFNMYLVKIRI